MTRESFTTRRTVISLLTWPAASGVVIVGVRWLTTVNSARSLTLVGGRSPSVKPPIVVWIFSIRVVSL